MRFTAIFTIFTAMMLALPLTGRDTSSVLAVVNGKAVTLGEVLRESSSAEALARAYAEKGTLSRENAKLREEAVDRIIDRKLLVDEFHRLKLVLAPRYVESMLDDLAENLNCRSRSELALKARAMNTTLEELREKASERLMAEMVIGREFYAAGEPTPREMVEYFKSQQEKFSKPERLKLALLLLPENSDKSVVEKLQSRLKSDPGSFAELVKAFSCGPNREQGGAVGFIERKALRSEFAQALPKGGLKALQVYGPIKTDEGTYFLQIAQIQGGVQAKFADHREAVRQLLLKRSREKAVDDLKKRLRKQAVIRYYFGHSSAPQKVAEADNKCVAVKAVKEPSPEKPVKKMEKKTMVTLKTNHGDIKLELFADAAPKTVENFLEYVKSGFYNGTLFHRVIDGFMIQGGGFDRNFKQKATRAPIQNEADNRLSNEIGTIAMARTMDPHSATAQFFINVNNNDFLDYRSPSPQFYGYCVFGKVVEGMDVVNKIKTVKTGGRAGHQDVPKEDVVILEAIAD